MIHLVLPNDSPRPLPFYLALEEVAARHLSEIAAMVSGNAEEECFFTWIVAPTVIFGRNQVMENEVNVEFCREKGIQLVQRKSGGGCVYADEGNIMMSYITPLHGDGVEEVFARYLQKAVETLNKLGIQTETTGRNDILLKGRKISGSALYVTPDRRHAIAHGTLLHSTDIERMVCAITPSKEKLAKNGVQSVRQRVTNLSEHIEITIPELRKHLAETLCDSEFRATDAMIKEAEELSKSYFYVKN